MEENDATGVRMSWQVLLTLGILLVGAGGALATIQIQVASLNREVVKYGTDVQEYRAEVRAMNAKFDHYIDLLVDDREGVQAGSSTRRPR